MNYTISSSQEGLIENTNKNGWATLDVGYSSTTVGGVIVEAITAKVVKCISGSVSEADHDLYGDDSFQQVENTLSQNSSIFVNNVFPPGTYGINYSEISSDATTFNITENQTAMLACAVYLQKIGKHVEVIANANNTSFQDALLHYKIPYKFLN